MSDLTSHFYDEVAGQLSGRVAQSWRRQAHDARTFIDQTLQADGPQRLSEFMEGVVAFGRAYEQSGSERAPAMSQMLEATNQLMTRAAQSPDSAQYQPGGSAFAAEVGRGIKQNLYASYLLDDEGNEMLNPHSFKSQTAPAQITEAQGQDNPLNDALQYHKGKLREHMSRGGSENEIKRSEKIITSIEAEIQRNNAPAAPAPVYRPAPVDEDELRYKGMDDAVINSDSYTGEDLVDGAEFEVETERW